MTLETCHGRRVLRASTERAAALLAEALLRRYAGEALTVGFSVACPDRAAGRRIAFYLSDVARELESA